MKWHQQISDFLEIAAFLANRESGRPKQASLRRATSSAYYAVFLEVAHTCADELVGYNSSWEQFTPICRSVEHAKVRSVLGLAAQDKSFHASVSSVSSSFKSLQNARLEADYNPEPFFLSRQETLDLISEARACVEQMRQLSKVEKRKLSIALVARTNKHG